MYLWHDGNVKREEEIRISPFDHGYLYGMGVFETFRTYEGHPFLFDDHIERLQMSCAAIGIQLPYGREQLLRAVEDLYRVRNRLSCCMQNQSDRDSRQNERSRRCVLPAVRRKPAIGSSRITI